MKAKLILNEIKRDRESGISALGIGKSNVSIAYDLFVKDFPKYAAKL